MAKKATEIKSREPQKKESKQRGERGFSGNGSEVNAREKNEV
jgi:hypothetical protein